MAPSVSRRDMRLKRSDWTILGTLTCYGRKPAALRCNPSRSGFDEVCKLIIKRSDSLFLIVSFLFDLIHNGATAGNNVAA